MSISIDRDFHIAKLQIYNFEAEMLSFIIFADKGKNSEIESTDRVHEKPHKLQVTSLRKMNRQ